MKKVRLVLRSTRTVVSEAIHEIEVEDYVAARFADKPAELETWALYTVGPVVPTTAWIAKPTQTSAVELISHAIGDA